MKKRFNYSDLSWLLIKEAFVKSNKSIPLEDFSFEKSGTAYPRLADLSKRARLEKWEYLRTVYSVKRKDSQEDSQTEETLEEATSSLIQRELESLGKLTDNLQLVYQTIDFCKDAQTVITGILPDLKKSLQSTNWNRLQDDPEKLVNCFQKLVAAYEKLNNIQAHYMGLTNPGVFLESVQDNVANSTLEDVRESIEAVQEDSELVELLKKFI